MASLFPLICFGWAGAVFAFQAIVSETGFHRDAGLGDTWNCPLPNGYTLLMIDTTEQGWVYNPRTQSEGAVAEQEDTVAGVRTLQVVGRYILGGSDTRSFQRTANQREQIDSYFLLDTKIGKQTRFPNNEALQAKAQELGIAENLEPIASIYSRYRFTWFEIFTGSLLLVPLLISAVLLLWWTLRVRKEARKLSSTPDLSLIGS